ncbi:MAG: hypothetical protein ACE5K4_09005 [Candidatus Hydrothermarchaeota archaeon]
MANSKMVLPIVLLLLSTPVCSKVILEYFWNSECAACKLLAKEMFFEKLEEKYGSNLIVKKYNTDNSENRDYFKTKYNGEILPHVVINERINLIGYAEITKNTERIIQEEIRNGGVSTVAFTSSMLIKPKINPILTPVVQKTKEETSTQKRPLTRYERISLLLEDIEKKIGNLELMGIDVTEEKESLNKLQFKLRGLDGKENEDDYEPRLNEVRIMGEKLDEKITENEKNLAYDMLSKARDDLIPPREIFFISPTGRELLTKANEYIERANYQYRVAETAYYSKDYLKAYTWAATSLNSIKNAKELISKAEIMEEAYIRENIQEDSRTVNKYAEGLRYNDEKINKLRNEISTLKSEIKFYEDGIATHSRGIEELNSEMKELSKNINSKRERNWSYKLGLLIYITMLLLSAPIKESGL